MDDLCLGMLSMLGYLEDTFQSRCHEIIGRRDLQLQTKLDETDLEPLL